MIKKLFIISLIYICCGELFAQNIFENKFDGCNTDQFTIEQDSIIVKQSEEDIVYILTNNFTNEQVKKIKGLLNLQILVDLNGKSCLLSIKNETNIGTEALNIKKIIDENLIWEIPDEKTSVIFGIMFYETELEIKRFGMSQENGFQVIK